MWKPVARSYLLLLAILGTYLVAAFFVENSYYQIILASIPIWASLATSWNIFSGYSGLISFGHSAFFALGAFTITLMQTDFGITPWIGLLVAIAVGAVSALLIGVPTFRLRGHYFALAMLAYPLSLMYVFEWLGYKEMTIPLNREDPLYFMQFEDPYGYTALAVGLLLVCVSVSLLVERSRMGLALQTIKQNEMAAQAAGINPFFWKTVALMVSGGLSAASGAIYVTVLLVTTTHAVFGLFVSASALIFAMFGGIGTVWGPLIGAALLVPLAEILHAEVGHIVPGLQSIVYGLAIILVAKLMPEGVFWRIRDHFARTRAPSLQTSQPVASHGERKAAQYEMTAPARLTLSNVTKSFGPIAVAKDISLEIAAGSITGIVGPNGAGKTTLFNLVNGYLKPDGGSILFDGQPIESMPTHKRAANGLGRTFQVPRVFQRLSVFDNILAGAAAKTADMDEARSVAHWAADIAELGGLLEIPASALSAYEVRLIEIARALAGRPRLLLLDETLAGLSQQEAGEVVRIIRKVRDMGITVVIIEHTMSAMVALVDRMVILNQGRVLADGVPTEVLKDRDVIAAYLGSKWAARAGS